jgi:hypothetical protein
LLAVLACLLSVARRALAALQPPRAKLLSERGVREVVGSIELQRSQIGAVGIAITLSRELVVAIELTRSLVGALGIPVSLSRALVALFGDQVALGRRPVAEASHLGARRTTGRTDAGRVGIWVLHASIRPCRGR